MEEYKKEFMSNVFLNLLKPNNFLSPVELKKMDEEFLNFDISTKEQVWSEMNEYFSQSPLREDRKFWYSYWRWFTDLSWKFFLNREPEFIAEMAVKRQVPMAILLDFDIWRELLKYFALQTVGEDDAQSLYSKIKFAFLESEAILGVWKDKEVTVAEIVKEFFSIRQRGSDALELAEFNSKLKEIFFPKDDPLFQEYIFVNPDEAIDRFTQLSLFFFLMEPKDIWYAVDVFMHPEIGGIAEEMAKPITPQPAPAVIGVSPLAVSQPKRLEPKKEKVPVAKISVAEEDKKLTLQQVKSQIESQFKKDAEGNFEDIAGVYAKLEELAEKYNDPKIAEMLYFDEKSGKFEWKI